MIRLPRSATRVGSIALAVAVGSGISAVAWLPASWAAGAAAAAASSTVAAGAGEDAVAGRVAISAVTIRLSIATNGSRGRKVTVATASVTNLMRTRLGVAVVALRADSAAVVIKPAAPRTLRGIGPGRTATTAWTLCSRVARTVVVVAKATVNGIETSSEPVVIRLPATARC